MNKLTITQIRSIVPSIRTYTGGTCARKTTPIQDAISSNMNSSRSIARFEAEELNQLTTFLCFSYERKEITTDQWAWYIARAWSGHTWMHDEIPTLKKLINLATTYYENRVAQSIIHDRYWEEEILSKVINNLSKITEKLPKNEL